MATLYRERIKARELGYLTKKNLRKKIVDMCKKITTCPYCGALNGVVKKCGLLKISHEKYRTAKKTSEVVLKKLAEYDDVVENNKELQSMLSR
jgi:DNA-directed RNA polymerase III subunit RPC1